MTTDQIIILARKHLGGEMESSARLCLADAIALRDAAHVDREAVRRRALRSLAYSVGIASPIYLRASR